MRVGLLILSSLCCFEKQAEPVSQPALFSTVPYCDTHTHTLLHKEGQENRWEHYRNQIKRIMSKNIQETSGIRMLSTGFSYMSTTNTSRKKYNQITSVCRTTDIQTVYQTRKCIIWSVTMKKVAMTDHFPKWVFYWLIWIWTGQVIRDVTNNKWKPELYYKKGNGILLNVKEWKHWLIRDQNDVNRSSPVAGMLLWDQIIEYRLELICEREMGVLWHLLSKMQKEDSSFPMSNTCLCRHKYISTDPVLF